MKKIFALITCIVLMFTFVTFAEPIESPSGEAEMKHCFENVFTEYFVERGYVDIQSNNPIEYFTNTLEYVEKKNETLDLNYMGFNFLDAGTEMAIAELFITWEFPFEITIAVFDDECIVTCWNEDMYNFILTTVTSLGFVVEEETPTMIIKRQK